MIISLYKPLHICYIFILLTDVLPLTGFTIILSYCGVIISPQVHLSFCFDCVRVVSSLGYSRTELRYIHKLSLTDGAWMHFVYIWQLFQSQELPSQSKERCKTHIKLNYRSTFFLKESLKIDNIRRAFRLEWKPQQSTYFEKVSQLLLQGQEKHFIHV